LTDYSAEISIAMAIFTAGYFFQSVIAPLNSFLIGHERVDLTSILTVAMQVCFMVLAGIVLYLQLSFVWLLVVGVINLPINLGIQLWMLRRNKLKLPPFAVNRSLWGSLLRVGLPFSLIQLSLSLSFRVDTIILSSYVTDQEIGWYNAAYNLIFVLNSVTRAFNHAMMPSLAREHALRPESVRPWYYYAVRAMLSVGLPVAVGGMLLADQIIPLLYGREYAPSSIAFLILIWDLPLLMYNSFCGSLTTSIKREKGAARIYGSMAITNIVLNLVLIPSFGIVGASFATVLTDLSGAAQYYLLFRREFGPGLGLHRLLRLGASVTVMGGIVYLLHDLNFLLVIPIAAVCYLLLVWFSQVYSDEERIRLLQIASRPFRR
jgi:O-antigen/teichoic acid export membrane protein